MRLFILPHVQSGISETLVHAVELTLCFKVFPAFDIIPLGLAEEESIFQMVQICLDGGIRYKLILFVVLNRVYCIRKVVDISKGAYGGADAVCQIRQDIGPFYVFPFDNVLEISFLEKLLQIGNL